MVGSLDVYPSGTTSRVEKFPERIVRSIYLVDPVVIGETLGTAIVPVAGGCRAAWTVFSPTTASTKRRHLFLEFRKRHFPIGSLGENRLVSIDCGHCEANEQYDHPEHEQ